MLYGPPGVGKFEYCLHMVNESLKKGIDVIFITTEMSPMNIIERAKKYEIDLKTHETKGFKFIDCYSWSTGEFYEEGFRISNPSNLNEINVAIAEAASSMKKPLRIIFDSLSPLFLHNAPDAVTRFCQVLTSRVKTGQGLIFYTLQEGVHDPKLVNTLVFLVDGYLQMNYIDNLSLEKIFRNHHLKGYTTDASWVKYMVGEKGFKWVSEHPIEF